MDPKTSGRVKSCMTHEILDRVNQLPDLDPRSPDEIIGSDEQGPVSLLRVDSCARPPQ